MPNPAKIAIAAVGGIIALAAIGFGIYSLVPKGNPAIGTWSYLTIELDDEQGELSEEKAKEFDVARSISSIAMQGMYITIEKGGSATVEYLDRTVDAIWTEEREGEYRLDLDDSLSTYGDSKRAPGVDLNTFTISAKLADDGTLRISNADAAAADGSNIATHAVFVKINPRYKTKNALYSSISELNQSVLADAANAAAGNGQQAAPSAAASSSKASSKSSASAASSSASSKSSKSAESEKAKDKPKSDVPGEAGSADSADPSAGQGPETQQGQQVEENAGGE